MKYIVTVKFKANKNHDPKKKIIDRCIFSDYCTDSTGAHHSVLVEADDVDQATEKVFGSLDEREAWESLGYHITRIETVR